MKSVDAMRAVDTNIVVRYLVKDDDAQSALARDDVVGSGAIFVPLTVVLECEWVLRSLYGFSGSAVIAALEAFCGAPGVAVGEAAAVKRAFRLAKQGLDFADALHLAQATECETFVTFDRRLARKAGRLAETRVRLA
jgi:predicted nucleic-acid-binding protein